MNSPDPAENTKTMSDFMRWIKKCFRKALKHGSDLVKLFSLVENYIKLRFQAYIRLFGKSHSSHEKKKIMMEHDEFFLSLKDLDLSYDELLKLIINDNSDEDSEENKIDSTDFEEKRDIRVEESKYTMSEELGIENKIAIIYYILHHNEMIFEWIETHKVDYLVSGFEICEIEIQRFKDFNTIASI